MVQCSTMNTIMAICFSLFVVVPLTFMAIDRNPPVTVHQVGIVGEPIAGGIILLEWEVTAARSCDGRVRLTFTIDGFNFQNEWEDLVVHDLIGYRQKYRRRVQLPNMPGKARMVTIMERWCNPLQESIGVLRIREIRPPIIFEIQPR